MKRIEYKEKKCNSNDSGLNIDINELLLYS